jgi:hypothetical protein
VNILSAQSAITYEFSGGRFGDNLLTYLHAKWLAHEYNMPFLYRPFKYSSDLVLDEKELCYDAEQEKYRKKIDLGFAHPSPMFSPQCLFICPYFPEIEWELNRQKYYTFKVDWKNAEFRRNVREMIALKRPCSLTTPPKDILSVAMHIRDGGAFDDYEHHYKHPLKTPPITYYIESIHKVLELFKGQPIYCHVFTDALQPQELVDQIEKTLPLDAQIVFNYRKENNRDDANVLEDFFSFFNFDVLIRAESNYSIVPALIHDFAVVYYPLTYSIRGRVVTIDKIKVDIDEALFEKCRYKNNEKLSYSL